MLEALLKRRGRLLGGLVAAVALAAFVTVAYGRDPSPALAPGAVRLPAIPRAAAPAHALRLHTIASAGTGPTVLSDSNGVSRFAAVLRPVAARSRPSSSARIVARLGTRTPEGTTSIVLLLTRVDRGGNLWIKVRLPVLPNNSTGWLPRTALGGYNEVTTHLVVDTSRLRATLYRNRHSIFSAPVGVGKPATPTPKGQFYIRNELTRYANAFYGPVAFGTSARSAVLTDWPAGGYVGIHGTDDPAVIPGRVSHGCVRLRNRDVLRLARLMPPGTPLTIR
jgi:hypothetical protein